jgi:hypothetical protein
MNDYIFSSRRIRCLKCGSSDGFAPIESINGIRITGIESGKCFACGVFVKPNGEYTQNTIIQAPKVQATAPALNQQQLKDLYSESMANTMNNPFAQFMENLLGENLAYRSLSYSNIGTDKNGDVAFWCKDYNGEITHCKIISYDANTCKRLKGEHSKIKWCDKFTGKITYLDCLDGYATSSGEYPKYESFSKKNGYTSKKMYGEWLLNPNYKHLNLINCGCSFRLDATAPVVLVESEKTAFLCNLLYPRKIFIATGGANGVTSDKVVNLLNRTVFVAFDNDSKGIESMAKVQQLIPNAIALNPAELGITEQKGDLFDYLVSDGNRIKQAIHFYNSSMNFNYHIDLNCDVTAPAMLRRKAVA